MKLPPLKKLLEYKHPRVLGLYRQNYPHNKLSAEQAFEETLKYLWLTVKHSLEKNQCDNLPRDCVMLRTMREIDEMWHEFILFTQDYTQFCYDYFGEYVHHFPNLFEVIPNESREVIEADVAKLLPYVYDNLGHHTVELWFAHYLI